MARLHEYQGKTLLRKTKIKVPNGGHATTLEEVRTWAEEIAGPVVVKGQIWVTGRANLGAIRQAQTPAEAVEVASEILGMQIQGFTIDTVLVEEKLEIEREFYAGVIIDDTAQAPVIIFSRIGGTGVEEITQQDPQAIAKLEIDIEEGLPDYKARNLIGINRSPDNFPSGLFPDDSRLNTRGSQLGQYHCSMIHQVLNSTSFQDGNHVMMSEKAACGRTPDVNSSAIDNQKIAIHPLQGSFNSFYCEVKIAGQ